MKRNLIFIFLAVFLISGYVHAAERAAAVKSKKPKDAISTTSKYHALIIGNNNYKNLPKLKTAVADATAVENLLKSQYGFDTKLLINATRKDILSAINDFRKRLGSKDNLLIYYAGHGEFDKTADRAYWLPVDAQKDDPVDWISATDITDNIKRIASRHILIVSDSCYSGTLSRAATGDLATKGERDEYIKKMTERGSRTLMASGGNEPVADEGGGGHSIFASAFLKALKEADRSLFTAEELFHSRVKTMVAGKSDQVPEYNDIRNSGHEGGDFVFQLTKATVAPTVTRPIETQPEVQLPELPKKKDFSIEELEKKAEQVEKTKAAWGAELKKMKQSYNQVLAYEKRDLPPDLKIKAWKKFSEAFSEDNLYSQEDDSMRQKAEERMTYWQEKQERIEQKKLEQKEAEQKKIAMGKRPEKEIKGKTYKDPITGMEFIFVKGGCYEMGDTFGDGYDNEKPVHEVCVDDFYIGKYEVTQAQWKAIMGNNPSYFKDCGDNCPVEQVSWNEIQEFINKLNQGAGTNKYRLPTEAEWEYAARSGGKKEKYAGTSNESELGEYAWYDKNSGSKTHPVGQKKPNGLGIYDMSGNVWEWVQDWYDENYYRSSPKDNPKGAYSGQYRVLRGGSWLIGPGLIRAANRDRLEPTGRALYGDYVGFRVALPAH
jgi:formylglycine-generating enzyme required for sulfatase activity/uncharacterized caspase-like protein